MNELLYFLDRGRHFVSENKHLLILLFRWLLVVRLYMMELILNFLEQQLFLLELSLKKLVPFVGKILFPLFLINSFLHHFVSLLNLDFEHLLLLIIFLYLSSSLIEAILELLILHLNLAVLPLDLKIIIL